MLSRYNPIDIEAALRAAPPTPPFPPIADRASWDSIRSAVGEQMVKDVVTAAEKSASEPIPSLPATLWLEFMRNGQREGFQEPRSRRRTLLTSLTLAECFENKGRFLDPALDLLWAICEESSWSLPAHQIALTNMERHHIDLGVAGTALHLAETDCLIGSVLDPLLAKRIRYEINQRCFIPYLTRHDFWWLYNSNLRTVNNWTAVCNCGVAGAAIYLEEDLSRLAEIIARAARSLDDYLSTFDADGGSTEGPGYWTYGFGHFTMLAHLVEQRTQGAISFWSEDIARKAAEFPLHTALSPAAWANFSDCDRNVHFIPAHLVYLSQRLDLPKLMQLARSQPRVGRRQDELPWAIRNLVWRPSAEPAGDFVSAAHDWYPGMMWMLARFNPADAGALVLAAKGGTNGEMHNQNDVGNIIVHVNGESLIPDLGRGRYTKFYFGPQRYQHFVNSSRGHSLPVVNGQEQLPGKEYGATLVAHKADGHEDSLALELKGAYPSAADLASLKRTVTMHRDAPRGWIELVDSVTFANNPGALESVLTTFASAHVGPSTVTVQGEKGALIVTFDPATVKASVVVEKNVDLALGATDVNLIKFALMKPVKQGTISLRIEPA